MAEKNRLSAGPQMRAPSAQKTANFSKKCILSVDGPVSLITLPARLKRDSRVARQRSWFWPEFGTANWNSILSRHDESRTRGTNYRRRSDWVFLWTEIYASLPPKKFGAGSLISTYRVVNTTLRAESEISGWEGKMSRPESFSYQV